MRSRSYSGPLRILCLVLLGVLPACGGAPASPVRAITSGEELERALRQAGADIEEARGELLIPSVPGKMLRVNGELLQIGDLDPEDDVIEAALQESAVPTDRRAVPLIWIGSGWFAVYDGQDGGLILLLSGLLGDPLHAAPDAVEEPFPPAVPFAMRALAAAKSRTPQEIRVLSYQPAVWPDACLGLGESGEACAPVETPGWLIQVVLGEKTYDLHSDEAGATIRWSEPGPGTQPEGDP
jgi:hypothetical protein